MSTDAQKRIKTIEQFSAIGSGIQIAMKDLEKAIKSLSDKQKEKIFNNGYNFMNLEEQSKHKYILNIDGHVKAFRLGNELRMGSVILLVDSPYRLWFQDKLIEDKKNSLLKIFPSLGSDDIVFISIGIILTLSCITFLFCVYTSLNFGIFENKFKCFSSNDPSEL